MSGWWQPHFSLDVWGIEVKPQNLARDAILLGLTVVSLLITRKETREGNGFNWEPIVEVAKLFAGIFLTIVPVIAILRAGEHGALHDIITLRSEEHTSELQSLMRISYAVFCLKKKKKKNSLNNQQS